MKFTKSRTPHGVYFSFLESVLEWYYFDTRTDAGKNTADCFERDAHKATDYICHIHAPWSDHKVMGREDLYDFAIEQALEGV